MKLILSVILLVGLLISPVMGMILEEPKEGDVGEITIEPTKPVETIQPVETLSPVFEIAPITYSNKVTIIEKVVYTFEKLLGLQSKVEEETIDEITVEREGVVIAVIPVDSKFNGMDVHKYCLEYQYGTDNWYKCEKELA